MRGLSLTLTALVLFGVSCTPESDIVSTLAPPLPIVDSSPYVCSLIPEQAFRSVTGVTEPLAEETAGTKRNGNCSAPDRTPPPLEVWWMHEGPGMPQEHLNFLLDDRRAVFTRHGGVPLPRDLGDGMVGYMPDSIFADQPYRVSAKFRCDNEARLIDIDLSQVAKGRDGIKDLIELMRIAQKRYGELYDCTPGK
ncbi:hypothetical protein GCM10012289_20080 [Nonomuraea cavernae]|uniref:Uncharacterized protein n=2 Tax=Nonomuraea cavernae TaxID=2045107 RepID=A0A918DIL6_9ACTN|nr:hypothetical protein GCM10012289_20080 [Nonomuraea cavernae]